MLTHDGEETGILLEGRLELVVGNEIFVLEAGDSYYLKAPARTVSATHSTSRRG
jgi:quercetin dioxygenase-like cupin family protein